VGIIFLPERVDMRIHTLVYDFLIFRF
jgi:hypothetical protein